VELLAVIFIIIALFRDILSPVEAEWILATEDQSVPIQAEKVSSSRKLHPLH
jgi:hypothetical protein